MDKNIQNLNSSKHFNKYEENDSFWRNKFYGLPTIDEDNETLLYDDDSSSSNTSYKDVQYSVKIPTEEKDYTGIQVLSDTETEDDLDTEFEKKIDQQYHKEPDKNDAENSSDENSEVGSAHASLSSLEGLSLNDEEGDIDPDEMEKILPDDDNDSMVSINKFIATLPIDDEIFYSHLPSINRDPTATVPVQTIEKDFEDKLVYLSEIFDPAHFWFQFVIGDEKYEPFDKFHVKINEDYSNLKKRELMISDDNFKEGMIVAAYVDQFKKWFRARIINNYNGERKFVRLFFIDYGTNGTCEKSSIRYLFNYFMKYPQYCFRGRIHGIVPLKGARNFGITQIEEFLKKISNYTTYATAVKYEPEEEVYQLKVIRRKGCIDMAQYIIDNNIGEQIAPWDDDGEFSIGPPCYLIPTFQSLEFNYPTFAQLENMKKADIDYNWIIDSNYLHSLSREDVNKNEDLKLLINYPQFSSIRKYFYGHK